MLEEGDRVPDYQLQGVKDGEIRTYSIEDMTDGRALLLGVYVYDFSPVCTSQMCDIGDYEWFTFREDVQVAGISGDGPYAHMEFAEEHDIGYPLLSDTSEEFLETLGVLQEEKDGLRRVPRRSMFLVGPDRRVAYRWVADDNWEEWESKPLDAIRSRLDEMSVA